MSGHSFNGALLTGGNHRHATGQTKLGYGSTARVAGSMTAAPGQCPDREEPTAKVPHDQSGPSGTAGGARVGARWRGRGRPPRQTDALYLRHRARDPVHSEGTRGMTPVATYTRDM